MTTARQRSSARSSNVGKDLKRSIRAARRGNSRPPDGTVTSATDRKMRDGMTTTTSNRTVVKSTPQSSPLVLRSRSTRTTSSSGAPSSSPSRAISSLRRRDYKRMSPRRITPEKLTESPAPSRKSRRPHIMMQSKRRKSSSSTPVISRYPRARVGSKGAVLHGDNSELAERDAQESDQEGHGSEEDPVEDDEEEDNNGSENAPNIASSSESDDDEDDENSSIESPQPYQPNTRNSRSRRRCGGPRTLIIHTDLGERSVEDIIPEPPKNLRKSARKATVEKKRAKITLNLNHVLFLEPTLKRQTTKRYRQEREQRRRLREAHRAARKEAKRRAKDDQLQAQLRAHRKYLLDDFAGCLFVASRTGGVSNWNRVRVTSSTTRETKGSGTMVDASPDEQQQPCEQQQDKRPVIPQDPPSDQQLHQQPVVQQESPTDPQRGQRPFTPILLDESDEEYDWDDTDDSVKDFEDSAHVHVSADSGKVVCTEEHRNTCSAKLSVPNIMPASARTPAMYHVDPQTKTDACGTCKNDASAHVAASARQLATNLFGSSACCHSMGHTGDRLAQSNTSGEQSKTPVRDSAFPDVVADRGNVGKGRGNTARIKKSATNLVGDRGKNSIAVGGAPSYTSPSRERSLRPQATDSAVIEGTPARATNYGAPQGSRAPHAQELTTVVMRRRLLALDFVSTANDIESIFAGMAVLNDLYPSGTLAPQVSRLMVEMRNTATVALKRTVMTLFNKPTTLAGLGLSTYEARLMSEPVLWDMLEILLDQTKFLNESTSEIQLTFPNGAHMILPTLKAIVDRTRSRYIALIKDLLEIKVRSTADNSKSQSSLRPPL